MSPFDGPAPVELTRVAVPLAGVSSPANGATRPFARFARSLRFAGPAVLASTAYMDPGNFAVNLQAGAGYGYTLLWVVLAANIGAMLFQALAAKLAIASGRNLAELCRAQYARPVTWTLWGVSELAAIATDLAEFIGGAIGFSLLLHIPLMAGMALTAMCACAILVLDHWGFRPLEIVLTLFVAAIGGCYVGELTILPIDWSAAGAGTLMPRVPDRQALLLAAGIVGATVMPHALFLHSGLMQDRLVGRGKRTRCAALRFSNREIAVALGIAGLVNMAIVLLAATTFSGAAAADATIEGAYRLLGPFLGSAAAALFLGSLIASGVASSVVGTLAGQIIMQGFLGRQLPIWLRRLVTMLPAFVVVGSGVDATRALVLSQVVLSLALPFAMVPLVLLTRRRDIMGAFANSRLTDVTAITAMGLVLMLDGGLLLEQVFG